MAVRRSLDVQIDSDGGDVVGKILIVDDERSVRDVLSDVLKGDGHFLALAEAGEEALQLIRSQEFDLAILDIRLPGMDGMELLQEIKSLWPDTEAIIVTGYASVETAVQALRFEAYDYITKPFVNLKEISLAVDRALEHRRLKLENRVLVRRLEERMESIDAELLRANRELNQLYRESKEYAEKLEEKTKQLSRLGEIGRMISSNLNLDSVLRQILASILSLLDTDAGSIMLLDEAGKRLRVEVFEGMEEGAVDGFSLEVGEGLAGYVAKSGEPIVLSDAIVVPLKAKGRTLGVLNIHSNSPERIFSEGDMHLALTFADYAAVAIENARLFEAVSRAKAEWERTFDSIHDLVWIQDEAFRIMRANKALASKFYCSPDQLIGRRCYRLFHNIDSPCPDCSVKKGKLVDEEIEYPTLGGTFLVSSFPIFNSSGEQIGSIRVAKDVTEQKKMRERLARSERLSAVGQMAAGLAHEIRNPLGSIVTAADLLSLKEGAVIQGDNLALLEAIKRESKRLNRILIDFLNFARPRELHLCEDDINKILEDVLRLLRSDENLSSAISIEERLDSHIPPIPLDRDQIKQVIWNIALNGIQAMPEGGKLTVASEFDDGYAKVRIRDSGGGIPQGDLNRIFQPFYTTKRGGTGLGLSIAYRIVEAHGGHIEVWTEEGRGTEFAIVLPAQCSLP
ncbi:MAG: response regulator [bacterium]